MRSSSASRLCSASPSWKHSAKRRGGRVEAVETRTWEDLASVVGVAPEVYVEVPLDGALEERLDALAARGLRAKVRCGGATVPSVAQLAHLVRACGERGLVFKATAGLHHAIRRDGAHGALHPSA